MESLAERFTRALLRHPRLVIALISAATLFFAWQASRVELNNSIEAVLPSGHPAVLQDHEIKQIFDSREMILVGVLDPDGVFNPGTLEKVKDLTSAIWRVTIVRDEDVRRLDAWRTRLPAPFARRIDSVLRAGLDIADRGAVNNLWLAARNDSTLDPDFLEFLSALRLRLAPVSDVISLAEVDNITATEYGLNVEPPMASVPQSPAGMDSLAATVFDNEMFINGLVSEDSTGTVILVELSFYYDDHLEMAHDLFEGLEALVEPYRGPEEIHLAGVPMVNVYTSNYMSGDLVRLMPAVIVVVLLVMFIAFRSVRSAFIPLAVVLVSLVWTLGVMTLVGRPITLVSSAMPIILIAIGIADGIHIITEYQRDWTRLKDRERAVLAAMTAMTGPVILTSLTDVAGFGSLAISSLASIRDFGIFTSVGVLAALIFSLTFIPAVLALTSPPPTHRVQGTSGLLGRVLDRIGGIAVRRRRAVVVVTIGVFAIAALALPRIKVGSTMVGYFKESSEIYQASQMINRQFGGTEVLNIVVDTRRPDGLKDPEVLSGIAALQDTLESSALVGYTTSLADYVRRINLVMHDNDPDYNRIPGKTEQVWETDWDAHGAAGAGRRLVEVPGRDLIAQYLLLYENAGGDDTEKLSDFDYSKANIVAQIRTDHTPMLRDVREFARGFARNTFGGDVAVTFAGCSNLCIVGDDLIIPSQLKSLSIAVLVVFGLLIAIFRSVRLAAIGLLPLVLTVLAVFSILGVFGLYLDAIAALIASMVLGIGIDYSIHLLSRVRALRREGLTMEEALRGSLLTSGQAIVFNSAAVALGFLVLLLSSFWPVIHIGWIVGTTMIVGAALTLVLVPALLSWTAGARGASEGATLDTNHDDIPVPTGIGAMEGVGQ